jgi:PAS domain S-box-containing protein
MTKLGTASVRDRLASALVLDPENLQGSLLTLILRVLSIVGVVVYVPSVYGALRDGLRGVAAVDTVAIVTVLGLSVAKRLPFRVRAITLSLVSYSIGVALLIGVGSISQIYLFGFSFIAVILLGLRAGLASVALNALTILAVGSLGHAAPEMVLPRFGFGLAEWLIITVNFTLVNTLITFATGAVIASVTDALTREVAARVSLDRERTLLRTLIDALPDVVFTKDKVGRFVNCNPATVALARMTREEEVAGKTVFDLFPAEIAGPYHADDVEVMAGRELLNREERSVDSKGNTIWYLTTKLPLHDSTGEISGLIGISRDITERKVAQEALRTSRDLLEKAQAMAHVGSWTSGVGEADEIVWSRECGRIFDVAEGTVITFGQIMSRVHPDDRERVMRARQVAAEAKAPIDIEHRIVRDDGRLCWVHARTSVERWNGAPRMVAVVQDITDRKMAEAARRESEDRYRRMVEGTSEGVWMYDANGVTTFMNGPMASMLGYSVDEAVGQPAHNFLEASEHAAAKERGAQRLLGIAERTNLKLARKDGTTVWTSAQANPLFDAQGRFEGGIVMVTDISARHHADEERARLAAIVESSEDAILSVRLDGTVVSWNASAERLFQFSADEMRGHSVHTVVPPAILENEIQVFEGFMRTGAVHNIETTRRRKDGTVFEVAITVSPVRNADGEVIGLSEIVRDLTQQRRAEAQLKQTEAHLRQAQKMEAIGVLAGGVAHDFNNVLSVILSFTSLVLDELKPGDPIRADIHEIGRAGERATELTRQLLAFSRKQVLQPQVLDLGQAVLGMEKMLRRLLSESIQLSLLPAASLGRVLADPGQIEQVVMNLAVNARDAMPSGGKLSIEVANVELDADYAALHHEVLAGSYVMLAVTDSGVGMDATTRERIFEPFFTTKELGKGTGLGLSTVFGIVKQSQGHIWVYSEPGRGTTFKVYLPRVEQAVDAIASAPPEPQSLRGCETVLLVEDEEQVRVATRAILQRHGYNVLDAQNGGEALLICEQFSAKIHLLLTDVVMPRMTGRQVAERLGPMRPDMKVLYVSGYTEDAIVHHGVLDAGIAFLAKPITPNALLRKVREVLD